MLIDPRRLCAAFEVGRQPVRPYLWAWVWILAWLPRGTYPGHHGGPPGTGVEA